MKNTTILIIILLISIIGNAFQLNAYKNQKATIQKQANSFKKINLEYEKQVAIQEKLLTEIKKYSRVFDEYKKTLANQNVTINYQNNKIKELTTQRNFYQKLSKTVRSK